MERMPVVREYETAPHERTPGNPLAVYTLMPERIRQLYEGEVGAKPLAVEAAWGARGSVSRTPRSASGWRSARTAGRRGGGTNTKGVMPWDEQGPPPPPRPPPRRRS